VGCGSLRKKSPNLGTKARSAERPSFYAATTSSSPNAPYRLSPARSRCRADRAHGWYLLSDDEARRLVRRLTQSCHTCHPRITCWHQGGPGRRSLAPVSWASAASVEVDATGSKIEALEGEEGTSAFPISLARRAHVALRELCYR